MRTVGQFKYVGITIIIYCQAKGEQEQALCVCVCERLCVFLAEAYCVGETERGLEAANSSLSYEPSRQIARSAEHTVSLGPSPSLCFSLSPHTPPSSPQLD